MGSGNRKKDTPSVYGAPPKRKVVPFRLREDLLPALDRAAKRAGRKRSQYIEDVVTAAIKRGRAA